MVDINNQILKLTFEEAQEEIAKLIGLGYTDLILTFPILEDGNYDTEDMISKFTVFRANFKGINLYLGNEIQYHYSLIHRLKNHDILTLNQSNYILLKLPPKESPFQLSQLIKTLSDYKIIISCIDEYKYFSFHDLEELKKLGVYYMVKMKNVLKGKGKKLLEKQLIDFLVTYDDITVVDNQLKKKVNHKYYLELKDNNYKDIIKNSLVN